MQNTNKETTQEKLDKLEKDLNYLKLELREIKALQRKIFHECDRVNVIDRLFPYVLTTQESNPALLAVGMNLALNYRYYLYNAFLTCTNNTTEKRQMYCGVK